MTVGRVYSNVAEFADRNILHVMLDQKENQITKLRDALSEIAEDCGGWLNSEIQEPSAEFIKAVKQYAEKALLE